MNKYWKRFVDWVEGRALCGMDNLDNYGYKPPVEPPVREHHEKTFAERMKLWIDRNEAKFFDQIRRGVSVAFAALIIVMMLTTVAELPQFGNPNNPANNEVSRRYIEKGLEETGGVNIVGGMILDYRAFDTLGESHVLFIAACAVIILIRNDRKKKNKSEDDKLYEPRQDLVLRKVAALQIPFILLFGIYIVLNGHISPGGGFSGGTVMGAALILYYNAFGTENVGRFFTYRTFNRISICALAFYAFAKCYSFFTGANHLPTGIPLGTPGAILSSGLILPLNIAVGVIVTCTMFGFYSLFMREEI
ncbi:MAG: MnhB domain-containing protein [Lachnospiraceae bacterium]|nr:MnhB domain-containing protein [Lachnospiraceae bacterium]